MDDRVIPTGSTTALPALRRAFAVLKKADTSNNRRGKLVMLLTDGQFSGIGGGSRYKGAVGNEAVIKWLRENNSQSEVHINTFLYGSDPVAVKVMGQIAAEHGGKLKRISERQ